MPETPLNADPDDYEGGDILWLAHVRMLAHAGVLCEYDRATIPVSIHDGALWLEDDYMMDGTGDVGSLWLHIDGTKIRPGNISIADLEPREVDEIRRGEA